MPTCGRLESASLASQGATLWFGAVPHRAAMSQIGFLRVLEQMLPQWDVRQFGDGRIVGRSRINWDEDDRVEAETVLRLLQTSVTIRDSADASHALRIHNAMNASTDTWMYSDIGKLVQAAKSYHRDWSPGDQRLADKLAREMLNWIRGMPLYADADMIVAAPSTNQNKEYDLPGLIAEYISSQTAKRRAEILSSQTSPQKGLKQSEKASAEELAQYYRVRGDVRNRSVIIIDDLYESGGTVGGVANALRRAGARRILSLTATKTAKGCGGLPAQTANWPMEA